MRSKASNTSNCETADSCSPDARHKRSERGIRHFGSSDFTASRMMPNAIAPQSLAFHSARPVFLPRAPAWCRPNKSVCQRSHSIQPACMAKPQNFPSQQLATMVAAAIVLISPSTATASELFEKTCAGNPHPPLLPIGISILGLGTALRDRLLSSPCRNAQFSGGRNLTSNMAGHIHEARWRGDLALHRLISGTILNFCE